MQHQIGNRLVAALRVETALRMTADMFGLERPQFFILLVALTLASCLTLLFIWSGLTTTDAEGRLVVAALGGIGVAFLSPLWGLVRGKVPLWLVILLVLTALLGVMQLNAWAVEELQDHQVISRFYEQWFVLPFSVPGFIALYRRNNPVA